ncbi:UNVERIFIED_CONTAM: hypothetical protein Sradi_5110600 [Sesamum radiatum]|uniref:Uncharacterized protein n=1 Tax=Sesamum radiatum TaxID=300843 RepID=A0AAW2M348_SESRA
MAKAKKNKHLVEAVNRSTKLSSQPIAAPVSSKATTGFISDLEAPPSSLLRMMQTPAMLPTFLALRQRRNNRVRKS